MPFKFKLWGSFTILIKMAADIYTTGNGFHGMWVWVPEIG